MSLTRRPNVRKARPKVGQRVAFVFDRQVPRTGVVENIIPGPDLAYPYDVRCDQDGATWPLAINEIVMPSLSVLLVSKPSEWYVPS